LVEKGFVMKLKHFSKLDLMFRGLLSCEHTLLVRLGFESEYYLKKVEYYSNQTHLKVLVLPILGRKRKQPLAFVVMFVFLFFNEDA
jgi:hypothetical protein